MLFGSTKIIIHIDRERVVVGDYRPDPAKFFEIKYQGELPLVFDKIIEQLPSSSYKIILGQKISYTVKLEGTSELQDRSIVKEELTKYIPEDFDNDQFDWKIDKDSKIEAIVMTNEIYRALKKIKSKYPKIRFETQSSTSLLWEMGKNENDNEISPDIFLYAANKGKEKGSDNMVLNVEVLAEEQLPDASKTTTSPSNTGIATPSGSPIKTKPRWPLIAILVFIVISLTILGWYLFTRQPKVVAEPTPTPTTIAATIAPVAQKLPAEFRILIQNGTSTPGLAAVYKTKLSDLGFTQIETGNTSESIDTTKILISSALPDSIQTIILDTLKPLVPEISVDETITSSLNSDILIILGTK